MLLVAPFEYTGVDPESEKRQINYNYQSLSWTVTP